MKKLLPVEPGHAREYAIHEVTQHFLGSEKYRGIELGTEPCVGDLVIMSAARFNRQWLSWVIAVGEGDRYSRVSTLRGVGETTLVDWYNCGLQVVEREFVRSRPRLSWLDEHWDWTRDLYNAQHTLEKGGWYQALDPIFDEDKATVSWRARGSWPTDHRVSRTADWRKQTAGEKLQMVIDVVDEFAQLETVA